MMNSGKWPGGVGLGLCLLGLTTLSISLPGWAAQSEDKPRLVMVKVPHWKVKFFALPEELPVLLEPGESAGAKARTYDFSEGTEAMEVFITLRPKDPLTPAFRRFQTKWPWYLDFFKSIENEQLMDAEHLLQQIRALDPEEPAVHFYSGSLLAQQGRLDQAAAEYQRCLELFPEYGPAYISAARVAKAQGNPAQAESLLRQGLTHMQDESQADSRQLAEKMLESLRKP
jgi:tetratricopeptide (TPR) repeat protein